MAVKSFEAYTEQHPEYKAELTQLREIITATELEETIKWGAPVHHQQQKCSRNSRL